MKGIVVKDLLALKSSMKTDFPLPLFPITLIIAPSGILFKSNCLYVYGIFSLFKIRLN